jgi:hypothetical protein
MRLGTMPFGPIFPSSDEDSERSPALGDVVRDLGAVLVKAVRVDHRQRRRHPPRRSVLTSTLTALTRVIAK